MRWQLAALAAGKAVLVEKSFTITPAATRVVAAAARAAGRFAMEAMWTRFCPAVVRLRHLRRSRQLPDQADRFPDSQKCKVACGWRCMGREAT